MKTIKIKTKRTSALLSAMLMGCFFVGCSSEKKNGDYAGISDVEFWGTYSTEKVLQNQVGTYDEIKQPANLNVSAIGGEEEAAQIIMTAGNKPVKEYDVLLSDLHSEDGKIFSKDNIKVYHERYIYVSSIGEYYRTIGYYPDCLVPFESVKKVGETGFNANNNQGLYVSFDIPEDQTAGTYHGSMQVVINEESKQIPITLTVKNGFITAETHVKSSFLNEWYFYRGELDTTDEMYELYNQKLFEYRLGCNDVVLYEDKSMDLYAETVCRYAKQIECPGYNIPWFLKNYKNKPYNLNGREISVVCSYDIDKMLEYFRAIAYKGLETGVDPFKKAFVYGYDEPDLILGIESAKVHVKAWSYIVRQCKNIVMQELRKDYAIENTALLEEILTSLDKMPHLVLSSTYLDNDMNLEEEDIVYCPEFQFLQTESARTQYRLDEKNDLWWYGCVNPKNPYPSYHIDDTVLSARIESWMKADYNIQGNLYWSTCYYSEPSAGEEAGLVFPEDLYSGNAARSLKVNGEGFIFYPGKKYGISGPLSSIRLEQIRDGLEEYEMLYKIREIYSSIDKNYSEQSLMRYLYDALYTGTKVGTTSENFEYNRSLLLDLFELACSEASVCITDVAVSSGNYAVSVYVKNGYVLKQQGKEVTNKTAVNGNGYLYKIVLDVSKGEALDLSVDAGGKTYGFAFSFASTSTNYNAQYFYDNSVVQKRYGDVSTKLVNPADIVGEAVAEDKWLQLSLAKSEKATQDFLLVDDKSIKKLHEGADKVVIRIYNASAETISSEVLIEYGNDLGAYASYETIQLKPGYNTVTIGNLSAKNWKEFKYINRLRMTIGEKGDAARDFLYLVDMSVYEK